MQHFVQHKHMNATNSCTVKLPDSWPHLIVYGRIKVRIHKRTTPSGHENFMVVYKDSDGKRKFPCFKTFLDAFAHADRFARDRAGLSAMVQTITSSQAVEYFAAAKRLEPFGNNVTVDSASSTIANCLNIVNDLKAVEAAVRFYKARHKTITNKTVADAVAEFVGSQKIPRCE